MVDVRNVQIDKWSKPVTIKLPSLPPPKQTNKQQQQQNYDDICGGFRSM